MAKAMAHLAVVFAELERDFIRRERTEGKTAYAIARDLNKDAVPTARVRAPGRKLRSAPRTAPP
jgi:hypothetical protein